MAYEIPVTQARAELADLINRVVYGAERVVVTRHGKPLAALVSAADLARLEALDADDLGVRVLGRVLGQEQVVLHIRRNDVSTGSQHHHASARL